VTLVEAVAATALLGTLLAAMLISSARIREQTHKADLRIQAAGIADGLLGRWWLKPRGVPRGEEGRVEGRPGWRWRMRTANREDAGRLDAEVVVLEILPPSGAGGQPAARVELLLPRQDHAETSGHDVN
jgi:hypothetical protein